MAFKFLSKKKGLLKKLKSPQQYYTSQYKEGSFLILVAPVVSICLFFRRNNQHL